jgi:hypothetical protein
MPVPNMTSQQLQQFNKERSDASRGLLTNQAQSLYNRELSGLAFKGNLQKFNIDWGRKRTELPRQYSQRGILNSGIYQQGLQDYAQNRLMGLNDLAVQNQLGNNQYTMQSRGYEDDYASSMMGSYNREFATKADIAAALRGIM